MPTPDPIAEQMRAARQRRGWSLRAMAERSGISEVVIGSWERGDRRPSLPQVRRWLAALGHDLIAVGPGGDIAATNWDEHAVSYPRPDLDGGVGLIVCDTAEEAAAIAYRLAGGRVVTRRLHASDWTAGGGDRG